MRGALYSISNTFGVERLFTFLNRDRPMVLAFHGVTSEEPGHICNHDGKHLHLPIFTRFMEYLRARYAPVSLNRVLDWLEGRDELPDRAVSVTFDDGYLNVLDNAVPVLKRLGIPATVFVVTDFVRKGKMIWTDEVVSAVAMTREPRLALAWKDEMIELPLSNVKEKIEADRRIRSVCKSLADSERGRLLADIFARLHVDETMLKSAWGDHAPLRPSDIKTLREQGIEVGSHSRSHRILARCKPDEMADELETSKHWIEETTNAPCEHFSYPNGRPGDFSDDTRHYVIKSGYRCALTTVTKRVKRGDDQFEIPRYTLGNNQTTLTEFAAEMSGYPSLLRTLKRGFVPSS
ncbi:MAG: polysaccharide deacetylase family protein [Candidatus Latescibacterota bacterium]|nr:MAG: polysaccharide deacetylase family protein [Candidatus Latescibacterota bacterium]